VILAALLACSPGLHGTLFDVPAVLDEMQPRLEWLPRASAVAGDLRGAWPPGDAYLLQSWMLLALDDASWHELLARCRAAIVPGGRVLLLAEHTGPGRPAIFEPLVRAYERTPAQYSQLLEAAGFSSTRVIPVIEDHMFALEGRP
jgi:hypothetical protein